LAIPFVPTRKNEPARAFIESVPERYRHDEPDRVVFSIPSDEACLIKHRPGHDPVEVINASKSKAATDNKAPRGGGATMIGRSRRYAELARNFVTGETLAAAVKSQLLHARDLPSVAAKPTTESERLLLALWEELLSIKGLGVNDDYFAIGGTSLQAATMFAEISRRFGVKLPLTTILRSPTVRLLSRCVEGYKEEAVDTVLELKYGAERNLFLVHDGDGETLLYANLANRLPDGVAVYAINPRSTPNVPMADLSIEGMARVYVEQVRNRQPSGPYFLGGMCAGGVIAFEMANQLVAQGEAVQLVALLDAATPQAQRRTGRIARQRLQRLSDLFAGVDGNASWITRASTIVGIALTKFANVLRWELTNRLVSWSVRMRFELLRILIARGHAWPSKIPSLSVRQIYERAEAKYFPNCITAGNVLVVRATVGEAGDTPYTEIYSDPMLGWEAVAPGLQAVDVEGGHFTMLQEPAVAHLARVLSVALTPEAEPQSQFDLIEETA
jgi:thioesterase domain-containing protein